ncbi:hypothetical protein [Rivularia sp. UHCC 0363]|uniref:hypothetical protein n=1 Tax=Rivularia sp. UHCC 0363 TaxID=3110244 RepID=UPI002B203214|nr:hypothetical protein [Rivularia sp. UHCC 0363]MEA5594066.1 hypothetical protein [Rivularia sp. UHCC 0363]
MAINHDRLFKELISTFFIEFLELFLPEIASDIDKNLINITVGGTKESANRQIVNKEDLLKLMPKPASRRVYGVAQVFQFFSTGLFILNDFLIVTGNRKSGIS